MRRLRILRGLVRAVPPLLLLAAAPALPCEPLGAWPGGRLGLVLGGGGAKGAYEAGVALALRERGVAPAAVAGTSSGALNATLVATGETERLAELWRTVRREDVFEYRPAAIWGGLLPGWLAVRVLASARGLLDPAPLRRTLRRHVDLDRLRTAPVPLLVVAADLLTGEARRFDNGTLTLDALVASATVPGLFPPVAADGAWLVDGGVVQRAPLLELLAAHPLDAVLVVLAYGDRPPRDAGIQPVVERALELALAREVLRDVELARLRHPAVSIRVLRPSESLDVRPLDFDGARLERLVALGRGDGLRCLDALAPEPSARPPGAPNPFELPGSVW